MISLKCAIEGVDQRDLYAVALAGYVSAIESSERYALLSTKDISRKHKQRLRELRRKLSMADVDAGAIRETAEAFDDALSDYHAQVAQRFAETQKDIKDVLAVLAGAAEMLSLRDDLYSMRFKGFAKEMEAAAQLRNLSDLKSIVGAQVSELRSSLGAMSKEHECSVSQFRAEIDRFQRRLEQAEAEAATDPLTGIGNRREAERQLARRVQEGRSFCMLLFDLNDFKNINDVWGHAVGDQVLRTFARRLTDQIRPGDVVCRWGGDEFIAILDSSAKNIKQRAQEISQQAAGDYEVETGGRAIKLRLGGTVGYAVHRAGETIEQLFTRADAVLYQAKGGPGRPDEIPSGDEAARVLDAPKGADALLQDTDIDLLTSLPRRATAEKFLDELMRQGTPAYATAFSISWADLFNSRYGYTVVDQVVTEFVEHLQARGVSRDLFRLGTTLFLAVLPGSSPFEDAQERMRQIAGSKLGVSIRVRGRSAIVNVRAIAETFPITGTALASTLMKIDLFAARSGTRAEMAEEPVERALFSVQR